MMMMMFPVVQQITDPLMIPTINEGQWHLSIFGPCHKNTFD